MLNAETDGIIFDIIRNSFVDGPGIRTTVFFKGCNLQCKWCHNPEGQSFEPQMMLYQSRCTECGKCRSVCPNNLEKCSLCGKCELYCPHDARKICGYRTTVNEVFDKLIKDKPYYIASGGGVTFSGGECMLQPEFLQKLLMRCKESGINTAVDTAGNVPWTIFKRILPFTDIFLYDIKLFDSEKHRQYTGVGNELILQNIKSLSDNGKKIIVRIPIVGGVNDSEDDIIPLAEHLKDMTIDKVELLPYHAMGESKSEALGVSSEKFSVPSKERMNILRNLFHY